jgi:hypothetical protein
MAQKSIANLEQQLKAIDRKIQRIVTNYLRHYVNNPAMETVEKGTIAQDRIVNILLLMNNIIKLIHKEGEIVDREYLDELTIVQKMDSINILEHFKKSYEEEVDIRKNDPQIAEAFLILKKGLNKKHLFIYLERELNWIIISVFSASYISAYVLMRSVFELMIGISTNATGGMSDRISKIRFLNYNEKAIIKKTWKNLCQWAHPYGKWEQKVCPVFYSHKPIYHEALCENCLNVIEILIGFLFAIAINKYGVDKKQVNVMIKKYKLSVSKHVFFANRFKD